MLGLTTIDDNTVDPIVVERLVSGEHPRPACSDVDVWEAIRYLVPRCQDSGQVANILRGRRRDASNPKYAKPGVVSSEELLIYKRLIERIGRAARWMRVDYDRPKQGETWTAIMVGNYNNRGRHWRAGQNASFASYLRKKETA